MKKILVVVITMCFSCLVFAQEEGVKIQLVQRIPMGDGTMVYRYATGDKQHLEGECRLAVNEREYIVADFKNGLPNGKWETYRYNKLYEKRNYKDGRLDGKVVTYASDGKTVVAESTSSSGKRNGRYATYYSDGTLEKEQEFKEGKEHGYLRTYDKDGNIKWDCYYEDGKMHGQQIQLFYSTAGNYVKTSNYNQGKLIGDYSEYFEEGALKEKGQYDQNSKKTGIWQSGNRMHIYDESEYVNGERNGKRKRLFSDGGISKLQTYKNDKQNGLEISYSEKTRKAESETTYVDDRKEGPFKTFYEDGKSIKSEGIYTRGNVTKRKTYFPNGKLQLVEEGESFDFKVVEEYDESGKRIK